MLKICNYIRTTTKNIQKNAINNFKVILKFQLMMVKLSVEYSHNTREIINSFKNEKKFDTLIINNVPSVSVGYDLISGGGILAFQNIRAVILRINEKINVNFLHVSKIFTNNWMKPVLIAFTSMTDQHESITFWKLSINSNSHSIYIDDDKNEAATSYLHDFLIKEIADNKNGERFCPFYAQ